MVTRVLLALDDSQASHRATDYVAEWIRDRSCLVHIVHVLPPLPAEIQGARELVSLGAGRITPEPEAWLRQTKDEARKHLERARERLSQAGVEVEHVDCGFIPVHTDGSVVARLLELARENACETIAVGRNTLPWHRELFHRHVADELVRKAEGFTVWVVE